MLAQEFADPKPAKCERCDQSARDLQYAVGWPTSTHDRDNARQYERLQLSYRQEVQFSLLWTASARNSRVALAGKTDPMGRIQLGMKHAAFPSVKTVFSALLLGICTILRIQAADQHFDELTVGDDSYRDVTVTRVTETDIYFTHANGMGNAKLRKLAPELQRAFEFDPAEAAEAEASAKDGAANYSAAMQRVREIEFHNAAVVRQHEALEQELAERQAEVRAQGGPADAPWVNKPAPKFIVEKWISREPDFQGKCVLIDFWATWCGPCRQSIPALNEFHRRFADRLVIVGLSSESEADVRRMTSPKLQYYSAIDTKAYTARAIGVRAIPHAILIGPDGIVRYQGHPAALSAEVVENLLDRFGS